MARTKRARKIRKVDEFSVARLNQSLTTPVTTGYTPPWSIDEIRNARDAQMRGQFRQPALMRKAMRTDPAIFPAYTNRLAPERSLPTELVPAAGSRGESIAREADALFGENGAGLSKATRADAEGCLVDHGIAILFCIDTPREDGTRVDKEIHYWPIEFVRWDPLARCLMTQVQDATDAERQAHPEIAMIGGGEVPIVHGDGRWIVIQKHEYEPWSQDACLLPAANVWSVHAYATRDWAKGSGAHGNAKAIGTLPEGFAILDEHGNLTRDAREFLQLMQAIVSPDSPAGIKPFGSTVDYLVNSSTAWQVWDELKKAAAKDAARVYLGTDGVLGAAGGAPGVDISMLFGVATTKVQGDLGAIERAIQTGAIEPWCATNFGDSSLAPTWRYKMPEPDAAQVHREYAERSNAFHADVEKRRALGYVVDQPLLNTLAAKYDVIAPTLPIEQTKRPTIQLAPTDLAGVVSVNEARASAGLGNLVLADGTTDPDGALTVAAYRAKQDARANAGQPSVRPLSTAA